MGRSRLRDVDIRAPVPLISLVGPPLYRPAIERLSTHDARNRRPELAGPTDPLYDDVAVLAMDPISELMRLNSGPVRLEVDPSKKKALGAHVSAIGLDDPIRVTDHVGPHSCDMGTGYP